MYKMSTVCIGVRLGKSRAVARRCSVRMRGGTSEQSCRRDAGTLILSQMLPTVQPECGLPPPFSLARRT